MKTQVAETSIDAYHALQREGTLTKRQAQVMEQVQPGRDYSLQELVQLTGLPVNVISGRCNELRAAERLELAGAQMLSDWPHDPPRAPADSCRWPGRAFPGGRVVPARPRKRQPAPINPLDLDALEAAGLNSAAESERLLRAHQKRERIGLELELQRKKREGR